MTAERIAGINIQKPWSEMLLRGEKTVETRSYPLPKEHVGNWLAVIETPGRGTSITKHSAQITGKIKFSGSFLYRDEKHWALDFFRHKVPERHPLYGFKPEQQKWGWLVEATVKFSKPLLPPRKRGIIFATECLIITETTNLTERPFSFLEESR